MMMEIIGCKIRISVLDSIYVKEKRKNRDMGMVGTALVFTIPIIFAS